MRADLDDLTSPAVLDSFVADDAAPTREMQAVMTAPGHRRAIGNPLPAEREPHGVPALGERIGRYVALRSLGQGGMGVVIAAHDPELDRQVAIKLVHPTVWQQASAEARDQLRQEARAMARLVHPNVVAVHDLGTVGDQVFVAMELVDGTSLDRWLAERARPWREALAVCRDAGRGLAAAHRAGLVHRDVKPHNVLIDGAGRPRIADFGLAALTGGVAADVSPGGTPAYMSPEQHRKRATGPASDQFNYCVMVYEALYGERPFAGTTVIAIAEEVTRGRVRPPPPRSKVPRSVRRALLRGLSADPELRFATMDALLVELEPRPVGRWIAIGAAVAIAAGTGAAVVAVAGDHDPVAAIRHAAVAQVGDVWSPAIRKDVQAAIRTDPAAHAEATAGKVAASLDRYLAGWIDARLALADRVRTGDESPLAFGRRRACLDRRLAQVGALIRALVAAGPAAAGSAIDAVAALPPVASCVDGEAAVAVQAPPDEPALRARHDALLRRIDEVTALDQVGRARDAAVAATELVAAAHALGHPPLLAQALHLEAVTRSRAGDADHALRSYRAAIAAAAEAHDDELAARAWVSLIGLLVTSGKRPPTEELVVAARAAVVRAGRPTTVDIHLEDTAALVAIADGRAADGEAGHRRAIARADAELPGDHRLRAELRLDLVAALSAQHRGAEAVPIAEDALRVAGEIWGERHPSLALYWSNLGVLKFELGDYAGAEAAATRTAELAEPGTKMEGVAKMRLAPVRSAQGRDADAIALYREAAALFERTGNRRQEYEARLNLGIGLYNISDPEAPPAVERALALGAEVFVNEPHMLAYPESVAGMMAIEREDYPAAERHCRRAIDLTVARFGRDDPEATLALVCVSHAKRSAGDPAAARPLAEEAVRVAARAVGPMRIEALAELARVLTALGDRRGARARFTEALAVPGIDDARKGDLTAALRALGP